MLDIVSGFFIVTAGSLGGYLGGLIYWGCCDSFRRVWYVRRFSLKRFFKIWCWYVFVWSIAIGCCYWLRQVDYVSFFSQMIGVMTLYTTAKFIYQERLQLSDLIDEALDLFLNRLSSKNCNVFLSYKSEDARLVRDIADWLIANDVNVWFDEYQIILHSRRWFKCKLRTGLNACDVAIIFTGLTYASSHWTMKELRHLLGRAHVPRVLQVRVNDETPDWEGLDRTVAEMETISYTGDRLSVKRWIATQLGFTMNTALAKPPPNLYSVQTPSSGQILFEGDGWMQCESENVRSNRSEFAKEGCVLTFSLGDARERASSYRAQTGLQLIRGADRTVGIDKRFVQSKLADGFREYLAGKGPSHCRGINLVFLEAYPEVPQVGFTYFDHRWERRYYLEVPTGSATSRLQMEVQLAGRWGREFKDFVAAASEFDELVSSIKWLPIEPTGPE